MIIKPSRVNNDYWLYCDTRKCNGKPIIHIKDDGAYCKDCAIERLNA